MCSSDLLDRLEPIRGNPPSPISLPAGCVFHPRCLYSDRVAGERCATERPELLPAAPDHEVRCHLAPEVRRSIAGEVLRVIAGGSQ